MHITIPTRLIRDGYIHVEGWASKAEGKGSRYTLCIPMDLLDDPSTQILLRDEFEGIGYEATERQLLDKLLPSECLFLDIGAHWGIYSLHVLSAVPRIQVVAVEPDTTNLRHLRHNIDLNGLRDRINIVPAAVSDEIGTRWLKGNTAMGHHVSTTPDRPSGTATEVATVTIDSLVKRFDPDSRRKIWIKIDIEGRERAALEGAASALKSGRVGGILWEARVGGMANPDEDAISAFLTSHGMITRTITEDYRLSTPIAEAQTDATIPLKSD